LGFQDYFYESTIADLLKEYGGFGGVTGTLKHFGSLSTHGATQKQIQGIRDILRQYQIDREQLGDEEATIRRNKGLKSLGIAV